jgi:hypothetical protein
MGDPEWLTGIFTPISVLLVVKSPPSPPKLTLTKDKIDVAGEQLLVWREWQAWRFIIKVDILPQSQEVMYQV